jgi:hypothetical protein
VLGEVHVLTAKTTSALAHALRDALEREAASAAARLAETRLLAVLGFENKWTKGIRSLLAELTTSGQ